MRTSNRTGIDTERIKMQITIENVAKILKVDINLDGVTVVAGYNNMGKSTILKAVYIVFKTFRNANRKVIPVRKRSIENYILNQESYFDNSGYEELPHKLLYTIAEKVNDNLADFMKGNKDNYSLFKRLFFESLEVYAEFLPDANEYDRINTDEFIKPLYDKINEISTRSKADDLKYIAEMYIRNVFRGQMNSLHNKSNASVKIDSDHEHYFISVQENRISAMKYSLNTEADVFYLPAYNLLDIVDSAGLTRSVYSPEYDINIALQTQEKEPTFEEYHEIEGNTKLIREIFKEVIHGKLEKLPSGKISYKDENIDDSVNIGNVASGMKNFLIIQSLVEKGKLKRNSILLIDEPETNLHPEWHLKFAEILVLMYKHMGVRSIVNSHSPYFIRALEVQMANHEMKDKGHYYLMEEADRNLYTVQNVSETTDKIYELLYKPLEYL